MLRPYLSSTSFLCRLRPTVTSFPLWTALPSAEYSEVIRLPPGLQLASCLLGVAYRLRALSVSGRLRPPSVSGFPLAWLHIRMPCATACPQSEPDGPPKFLTLLSTPPTL